MGSSFISVAVIKLTVEKSLGEEGSLQLPVQVTVHYYGTVKEEPHTSAEGIDARTLLLAVLLSAGFHFYSRSPALVRGRSSQIN